MAMKKITSPIAGGANPLQLILKQHRWVDGSNNLYTEDGQYVCIHLPDAMRAQTDQMTLLVVVHGYSARKNNAGGRQVVRRFASYWGEQVAENNWVVLAPHFDEKRFHKDYQRLNRFGLRADWRLNQLVADASILLPNLKKDNRLLLGFSGGGQFVHRYAAFHENQFSRIVVGAPGWFMWPDPWLIYPLGLGDPQSPAKGRERLHRLCRQKMLLLVGEKDQTQGAFRENYFKYNLCEQQGGGRRQRATNWFLALKKVAEKENIQFRSQFQVVKHMAHRINDHFTGTAVTFLAGSDDLG
jgi:pimeloyl-ACP methyl ester carboxylesterase